MNSVFRHMSCLVLCLVCLITLPVSASGVEFATIAGANGVPLNVISKGDNTAQPILFIHGIGQSHLSWEAQFSSNLADDFYLIAFDLRGHGKSGKPWGDEAYASTQVWADDVAAVLKYFRVENPIVVAWSYGSFVILDYVRHYGTDNIAGINFVGAYGGLKPQPQPDMNSDTAKALMGIRQKQNSPQLDDNIDASKAVVEFLTEKDMPKAWKERAAKIGLMLPTYARQAMMTHSLDNQDMVEALNLPVLFSIGEKDAGSPPDIGQALATELPNGTLSLYQGVGHSPFVENAERFNLKLRAFAEGIKKKDN